MGKTFENGITRGSRKGYHQYLKLVRVDNFQKGQPVHSWECHSRSYWRFLKSYPSVFNFGDKVYRGLRDWAKEDKRVNRQK